MEIIQVSLLLSKKKSLIEAIWLFSDEINCDITFFFLNK